MTVPARRVAAGLCAAGALALVVSLFLSWGDPFYTDAWERFGVLDVAMAATAALGFAAAVVPRLRPPASVAALAVLVTLVIAVHADALAATSTGPFVAFVSLLLIAAGGTDLRGRPLALVGTGALAVSTFAAWYVATYESPIFHRSDGTVSGYLVEAVDAWHQPVGQVGPGLVLAAAAVATVATGVIRARSR